MDALGGQLSAKGLFCSFDACAKLAKSGEQCGAATLEGHEMKAAATLAGGLDEFSELGERCVQPSGEVVGGGLVVASEVCRALYARVFGWGRFGVHVGFHSAAGRAFGMPIRLRRASLEAPCVEWGKLCTG